MIKKKYIILALGIVSVLLGSMCYNSVTLADRAREPIEVDVSNLPIDEQGNLKVVHFPSSELVTLCVNQQVSLPIGERMVASCNISGWNYASVWWYSESTTDYYLRLRYRVGEMTSNAIIEWHISPGTARNGWTINKPLPAPVLESTVESSRSGQANITAYVYLSF